MADDKAGSPTAAIAALARELGDPTRLAVLEHLATEGPSGVSEMAMALDLAGPRLSNHLTRLRKANLVLVERDGRHAVYHLASPRIKELLASLHTAAEQPQRHLHPQSSPLRQVRSCYDHIAGVLGVALLEALQDQHAVGPAEGVRASIELGPAADEVLAKLGIDPQQLAATRRRFAFACLDWTERRAHLGGALGAAILSSLLERGWIARETGTRALRVTSTGKRALAQELNINNL